jgi:hypothetical protein
MGSAGFSRGEAVFFVYLALYCKKIGFFFHAFLVHFTRAAGAENFSYFFALFFRCLLFMSRTIFISPKEKKKPTRSMVRPVPASSRNCGPLTSRFQEGVSAQSRIDNVRFVGPRNGVIAAAIQFVQRSKSVGCTFNELPSSNSLAEDASQIDGQVHQQGDWLGLLLHTGNRSDTTYVRGVIQKVMFHCPDLL